MDRLVIDADGMLVGRLATRVARESLHGKDVRIVNCEKAVISGRKRMVVEAWKRKYARGVPRKGPFVDRMPDRFVRRIIRGMLPYKTARGRDAYRRVMCYIGTPADMKGATPVAGASTEKLPSSRFITVAQLCRELGGKWNE